MAPEGFGGTEFANQTLVNPVGLAAVGLAGGLLLLVPRRWAILPLIALASFVSMAQRVVVFNLDFNFIRILVLFGIARLLVRGETEGFRWRPMDKAVIAWAVVAALVCSIREASMDALVNRMGFSFDALGLYLMCRCLIRDWDDLRAIIVSFAVVSVPVAFAFYVENSTGRNAFAFFGGVPEITAMREGRMRCQGAFAHPIVAGCFWAAVLPLMIAAWWSSGMTRVAGIVGAVATCVIVAYTASSTPVGAAGMAVFAMLMFFARHNMRQVRWALAITLILLHMVMKKPVWHLLARIDLVGGSTGYHRYALIDAFVNNFSKWWLKGTDDTYNWTAFGLFDITNQFVLEGIRGGLVSLVLFIVVLTYGFSYVGRTWRRVAKDQSRLVLAWSLGAVLYVHIVNFFGISYFGQINVVWYMSLAAIASLGPLTAKNRQLVAQHAGRARRAARPPAMQPVHAGGPTAAHGSERS